MVRGVDGSWHDGIDVRMTATRQMDQRMGKREQKAPWFVDVDLIGGYGTINMGRFGSLGMGVFCHGFGVVRVL